MECDLKIRIMERLGHERTPLRDQQLRLLATGRMGAAQTTVAIHLVFPNFFRTFAN